jgi:hypothetical protein
VLVYSPRPAEGFEWILPEDHAKFEYFRTAITPGEGAMARWHPPPMRFLREDDDGLPLARSDFPWLGSHLLFARPAAAEALSNLLAGQVEALPVVVEGEDLSALHVLAVLDALDEDRSEVRRFPSTGRVMAVGRASFEEAKLGVTAVFKIPQFSENRGPTWVTDAFVRAIETEGMTGLAFKVVGGSHS